MATIEVNEKWNR